MFRIRGICSIFNWMGKFREICSLVCFFIFRDRRGGDGRGQERIGGRRGEREEGMGGEGLIKTRELFEVGQLLVCNFVVICSFTGSGGLGKFFGFSLFFCSKRFCWLRGFGFSLVFCRDIIELWVRSGSWVIFVRGVQDVLRVFNFRYLRRGLVVRWGFGDRQVQVDFVGKIQRYSCFLNYSEVKGEGLLVSGVMV